jgi:hypothetical protein
VINDDDDGTSAAGLLLLSSNFDSGLSLAVKINLISSINIHSHRNCNCSLDSRMRHEGAMTLFKWRQNARYLNGAKMRVIKPE